MPTLSRRHFLAAATVGIAGTVYGAGSNDLQITHPTHPAPPGHPPLRVALLTDMHAPHDWVEGKHLVDAIRRFDPHIITIVGDAVDERGEEHHVAFYDALTAPLGKFATLGNWEYQGLCDLVRLRREYDKVGVRLLINETVYLDHQGTPLQLIGLDDLRAGMPNYALLDSPPPPPEGRTLVLAHCPKSFDSVVTVARRPVTVLSGHTHGGQIAPFGVAIITPDGSGRYVQGWYPAATGGHALYVSRGLGNSGIPFRIGARPELPLLTI
jgi:uncharacterized protein